MTHVTTYMICIMELLHNNINNLIVHVFSDDFTFVLHTFGLEYSTAWILNGPIDQVLLTSCFSTDQ